MEIARSDAGKVEGVDGGEEEESGEDEGDGGACHHLLLHWYLCRFDVGEKEKRERKINKYMQNRTNEEPLFLFLVTLLLSLVTHTHCKKKLLISRHICSSSTTTTTAFQIL